MKFNALAVSALLVGGSYAKGGSKKDQEPYVNKYQPEPNVTRVNWMSDGPNRWAFKHISQLQTMAVMTKGSKYETVPLPYSHVDYDVGNIPYTSRDDPVLNDEGKLTGEFTYVDRKFKDMLDRTLTDGIVVMFEGDIVYEKYFDGQTENTRHLMFSTTKSYAGLMCSMMAHEGLLDPEAMVTDYVPDLKDSAFADATVRQVMDMSADYRYREAYADDSSEVVQHIVSMNLREVPGYNGPSTTKDFLINIVKDEETNPHGYGFTYRSSNTDVLGWIMDNILGYNGASMDWFSDNLWSKLGQEHDAMINVDTTHFGTWSGGAAVTTRDAARFGEMMRLGGVNAWGEQIVPKAVVDDIVAGGTKENVRQFTKSTEGQKYSPFDGWAYRNQYWVDPGRVFSQVGIYGQYVWVDTKANLVIAKHTSFPTAAGWINDNETLDAFKALGKHFQELKKCTEKRICPAGTSVRDKMTKNELTDIFSTNKISCHDFYHAIATSPDHCTAYKSKFVKRCCREE